MNYTHVLHTSVHNTCHVKIGLIKYLYIKIQADRAYTVTTISYKYKSPQATLTRRARFLIVVMVKCDGQNDEIFRPDYRNLQNSRFSAKMSIRNISFNILLRKNYERKKLYSFLKNCVPLNLIAPAYSSQREWTINDQYGEIILNI